MAFWNRKSEDPWDMDPNQRRHTVTVYEQETSSETEPEPYKEQGMAMPGQADKLEQLEEVPDCPWCQQKMARAYLLGGRDGLRLSDQKPSPFLGSLGHDTLDFSDDGFWTTHKSCWQCKTCRKLIADIPDPVPEDSFACWDGNPVAPPNLEEIEKEE